MRKSSIRRRRSTRQTRRRPEGGAGVLAYYEPWGDVVLFYDDFSMNGSLYALGQTASGSEQIHELTGTVTIEKVG